VGSSGPARIAWSVHSTRHQPLLPTIVFSTSFFCHELESITAFFGNPLSDIMSTTKADPSESSPETLKLVEQVLDYIRANLVNIRNIWGAESVQYKSAAEIMDHYLEENMKRLKVKKPDLEELMKNLSLDSKLI